MASQSSLLGSLDESRLSVGSVNTGHPTLSKSRTRKEGTNVVKKNPSTSRGSSSENRNELQSYLDEIRYVSGSLANQPPSGRHTSSGQSETVLKKEVIDWSKLLDDSGSIDEDDMIPFNEITDTSNLFLKSSAISTCVKSEVAERPSRGMSLTRFKKDSLASIKLNTEELMDSETDISVSSVDISTIEGSLSGDKKRAEGDGANHKMSSTRIKLAEELENRDKTKTDVSVSSVNNNMNKTLEDKNEQSIEETADSDDLESLLSSRANSDHHFDETGMGNQRSSSSESSRSDLVLVLRHNIFSVDQLYAISDEEPSVMNMPTRPQVPPLEQNSKNINASSKSKGADRSALVPQCIASDSPIMELKSEVKRRPRTVNEKSSFAFTAKSLQDYGTQEKFPRGSDTSNSVKTDPESSLYVTSEEGTIHSDHTPSPSFSDHVVASRSFAVDESSYQEDTASQDDFSVDFSDAEQLNQSDLTESRQNLLHEETSTFQSSIDQEVNVNYCLTRDACVQTSSHQLNADLNYYGSYSTHPTVSVSTHYGKEYLDPRPIMLSADALEAVTAYSPSAVALNDMLRLQLHLTRQLVETNKRLVASFTSSLKPNYHYTSLQDTKQFIARNRPRILTYSNVK